MGKAEADWQSQIAKAGEWDRGILYTRKEATRPIWEGSIIKSLSLVCGHTLAHF